MPFVSDGFSNDRIVASKGCICDDRTTPAIASINRLRGSASAEIVTTMECHQQFPPPSQKTGFAIENNNHHNSSGQKTKPFVRKTQTAEVLCASQRNESMQKKVKEKIGKSWKL